MLIGPPIVLLPAHAMFQAWRSIIEYRLPACQCVGRIDSLLTFGEMLMQASRTHDVGANVAASVALQPDKIGADLGKRVCRPTFWSGFRTRRPL